MTPAPPDLGPGRVGLTPGVVLAVAGLLGAGLVWTGVSALEQFGQPVPRVPWITPLALAVAAIGVSITAWRTHQRIQRQRKLPEPQSALRLLVVGKTALIAGVGLGAGYLTLALMFWPHLDAPLGQERVVGGAAAALASGALAVAGWFLEHACQVPKDDDDAPGSDSSGPGGPG